MHDPIYKRLFDSPRMVADLLRAVGHGDWLDEIDVATLEKLPGEHVGDHGQQRRGDAVWRVRFQNGWLYLLVMLEFQSVAHGSALSVEPVSRSRSESKPVRYFAGHGRTAP